MDYENSLKTYRDLKSVIDTAYDEGLLEGKLEGKLETAKRLKTKGLEIEFIAEITDLSIDTINKL